MYTTKTFVRTANDVFRVYIASGEPITAISLNMMHPDLLTPLGNIRKCAAAFSGSEACFDTHVV